MKNKQKIFKIAILVFVLDQLIKIIVKTNMNIHEQITIIPNFFSLYYVKNTGAAFSILQNNTTLLIIISVIFICLLNYFIKQEKEITKLLIISYGIILGGIYGNLIDRIISHSVTDYLSFNFFSYYFPVFNLADIAIVLGMMLLLICTIIEKKEIKE